MKLFENKLANRLAVSKSLGFLFWLVAYCTIPYIFPDADMYLRLAILFWYTTIWGFIGLMWIMNVHTALKWFKMPWWFRGVFIWAWMNFVIALFAYNILWDMLSWTSFAWYSPFWVVLEWAIIWLIIDLVATKTVWEGRELCEIK
jgi:hypothetical protein